MREKSCPGVVVELMCGDARKRPCKKNQGAGYRVGLRIKETLNRAGLWEDEKGEPVKEARKDDIDGRISGRWSKG